MRRFLAVLLAVYPIAEPDLLQELENQKSRFISYLQRERERIKEEVLSLKGEKTIPAKKSFSYEIDPTYCLEKDIYTLQNNRWKVLYPKGYCFNPIFFVPDPPPIFVFNACNEKEREKVKELTKNLKDYILVSSGCPLKKLKNLKFERPVYLLTSELQKKLKIRYTISKIFVDKRKGVIRVEVISVKTPSEPSS